MGLGRRHVRSHPGQIHRTRRELHRHGERVHQGALGDDHRRLSASRRSRPRPAGHRHQVLRQPVLRRPERRRRQPQVVDRGLRGVAAAAADGLHRPVLDAPVGSVHADRGDDARARRPGERRQGALHRLFRHAGVEDGPGAAAGALPGLDAARGGADRVLADRAHRRGGADPDGARARNGRCALVSAAGRRAHREVHPRERWQRAAGAGQPGDGLPRRADVRHRRRAGPHRRLSGHDAGGRGAGLGAGEARRDVDHHRRPHHGAAGAEPGRTRRAARPGAGRGARSVIRAVAWVPSRFSTGRLDHHALRCDGRWRAVGGLADVAGERQREVLRRDAGSGGFTTRNTTGGMHK